VAQARKLRDAFNDRDWAATAAGQAPGYFVDDRRPLGAGPGADGAAAIDASKGIVEVLPDVRWEIAPLVADDDAALFDAVLTGHTVDGGEVKARTLHLIVAGADDRMRCIVIFEPARRDEAEAEQRAWVAHLRQARFVEELMAARDFERLGTDAFAPIFRQVDRRPVGAPEIVGGAAMAASLRAALEAAPDWTAAVDVVAVAGDRRVGRVVYRGHSADLDGGEAEVELWILSRIDGLQLLEGDIYESRAAAEAALRTDPDRERHERQLAAFEVAINTRDYARIREHVTDDFRQEDRRELGGPTTDADGFVAMLRSVEDVFPNVDAELRVQAVDGDRRISRMRYRTGGEGAESELTFWSSTRLRGDRMCESVIYGSEEDARRAFAAFRPKAAHSEYARRFGELFVPATYERAVADLYAPDLRLVDHRPVSTMGELDYDGYLAQMRSMATTLEDVQTEVELLEVHGSSRLARSAVRATALPERLPLEMDTWYVTHLAHDGRIAEHHMFAGEAEAREWWAHREPESELAGVLERWRAAVEAKDWAAALATLEEDAVVHDHRAGIRNEIRGADAIVATLQALADRQPGADWTLTTEIVDERERVAVGAVRIEGADGSWQVTYLNLVTHDGRLREIRTFDSEQDARAALSALSPGAPEQAVAAMVAAFNARDWDAMGRVLAPDYVWHDQRPGLRNDTVGREAMVENMRNATGGSDVRWTMTTIETAGRFHLATGAWSGNPQGASFHVEFFNVTEVDQQGRLLFDKTFSPDQEDEARATFAKLMAADEPAVVAAYAAMRKAFDERDWDRYPSFFNESFTLADHRPGLRNEIAGRDAMVENMRSAALGSDVRWEARTVEVRGRVHIAAATWRGTTHDAPFVVEYLDVHGVDADGLLIFNESFAHEQEEEARACFEAHATQPPVLAYIRAAEDAFNRRDWQALQAMTQDDMVNHDRRALGAGIQGPRSGQPRALVEALPDVRWSNELIELLGPDRALARMWSRGSSVDGEPVEIQVVRIVEVDSSGRLARADIFDDERAARAWLAAQ
jgi:ketosteroid isomerase-like protein